MMLKQTRLSILMVVRRLSNYSRNRDARTTCSVIRPIAVSSGLVTSISLRQAPLLVRSAMYRLDNRLRLRHRRGIQRRFAPRHFDRQAREIDDASVAAVAAQVVRGPHEDAIHGARLNA